jgi:hypothetical protein
MVAPARTAGDVEELIELLKAELDTPEMRLFLAPAAFVRQVDLTFFISRGRVVKPPRVVIE